MTMPVRAGNVGSATTVRTVLPSSAAVAVLVVLLSVDLGPHRFPEWTPVRTVVLALIAGAGVAASLAGPTRWAERSLAERLLISAFGWAALTAPLTTAPVDASLVAAALLGTVLLAGAIARRWPLEQSLVGASFGFVLSLGVHASMGSSTSTDSRWAGLTEEPNALAVVAAFAVVVGLATVDHHRIGWFSAGLGALILLLTRAALPTAVAGVGALVVLLPRVPVPLRRRVVGSVFSLIAAVATSIALIPADSLPGDGDRMKSLNGRTGIWTYLTEIIMDHPLIGHGLTVTRDLIALGAFDQRVHWTPTHAHNALVQIGVGGGLPAAMLLLAAVIVALHGAGRARSREAVALVATFAGLAITEHLVREPTVALLFLALAAPLATVSSGPVLMSDVPRSDDIGADREHHGGPRVEEPQ